MPAASESDQRSRLAAGLQASERRKPCLIAAAAAAFVMAVVLLTGMTDEADQRLSDAWFAVGRTAPSGRTVLVTFNQRDRYAQTNQIPHGDLAQLLAKLDAAGVSRILIDFSLSEQPNEGDERLLQRVLTELGPTKISLPAFAVRSVNQTTWLRTGSLERSRQHTARTASDLALDGDGKIRNFGIKDSGLRYLIAAPVWLTAAEDAGNAGFGSDFRIDFGIDLQKIPQLDAASILHADRADPILSRANVIVAGFTPAASGRYQVPRYGELTLPQITALAAETRALGRELRSVPRPICLVGLTLLAAVMAFWCAHLGGLAGAGLCAGAALNALGLGVVLQTLLAQTAPAAGAVAASLIGYGVAQVVVHPAFRRVRHAVMTASANIDIHLAHALETTSDGLLTFNPEGKLLSINTAARQLFVIDDQDDLGQHSLTSMLGLQARALMVAVRDLQERQRVRTIIRKNGIERHLELTVGAVPGDGKTIGVATVRDITEQHAQFESMRLIATRDPLTGLANRRAFEQALKNTRPEEAPLALFICDLDGFKPINDTLGHQAGDVLLQEIARRMVAQAGSHAMVARLGGDEFGIVIPRSTEAYAAEAAERVLGAVRQPFEIDGNCVHVGVSIGIALRTNDQDLQMLIQRADAAMYDAKRSRSGYGFWRGEAMVHAGAQPISKAG